MFFFIKQFQSRIDSVSGHSCTRSSRLGYCNSPCVFKATTRPRSINNEATTWTSGIRHFITGADGLPNELKWLVLCDLINNSESEDRRTANYNMSLEW